LAFFCVDFEILTPNISGNGEKGLFFDFMFALRGFGIKLQAFVLCLLPNNHAEVFQ